MEKNVHNSTYPNASSATNAPKAAQKKQSKTQPTTN
jgi:hypothetical protein